MSKFLSKFLNNKIYKSKRIKIYIIKYYVN